MKGTKPPRVLRALETLSSDTFRSDLGSLILLEASIASKGLMNPIIVNGNDVVLSGARRLEAARRLGWESIPVYLVESLVDARLLMDIERRYTEGSVPMKISELGMQAIMLEAVDAERAATQKREWMKFNAGKGPQPKASLKLSEARRDIAAPAVGLSKGSYNRVRRMVVLANNDDSPLQRVAIEACREMDATGNIGGPYSKIKEEEDPTLIVKTKGKYAKWDKSNKQYKQRAANATDHAWRILHHLDVATPDLAAIDIELVHDGSTSPERREIIKVTEASINNLRTFQRNLEAQTDHRSNQ